MENRTPVMSRTYEKGQHREAVYIYLLAGQEITGALFRFAVLLDNAEQEQKRLESGNKYEIRKKVHQLFA
jgi:hypothetical protein